MQHCIQARHPTARNKGKEPIVPNNIDTPTDDELSLGSSSDLSPAKSRRVKSRQRRSHRPAFSNADSGTFRWGGRETDRGQNQPNGVPENASELHAGVMSPMPPVYPAFGTGSTLYTPSTTAIRIPNDMLSSPLGQHILNYKPPRGFVMLTFAVFDGSRDPYDHMLHYNQAMTLNVDNDHLFCKVFLASLQGPTLTWFHKLPRNSINSFNEL